MNKIVLCEGKTDAIILSYFLIKHYNWEFMKTPANKVLTYNKENETLDWYRNGNNTLAIWGTGGIECIPQKLHAVVERNSFEHEKANRFTDIVLMFDRDTRTGQEVQDMITTWLRSSNLHSNDAKLDQWFDATHSLRVTGSLNTYSVKLLLIVIPPDGNGALEKFLIDALREQETDKLIFDKTSVLMDEIKDASYLSKKRYKDKAHLGCILSIMSPDWVFSFIDDRLNRVEWDKLPSVLKTYEKLSQLVR